MGDVDGGVDPRISGEQRAAETTRCWSGRQPVASRQAASRLLRCAPALRVTRPNRLTQGHSWPETSFRPSPAHSPRPRRFGKSTPTSCVRHLCALFGSHQHGGRHRRGGGLGYARYAASMRDELVRSVLAASARLLIVLGSVPPPCVVPIHRSTPSFVCFTPSVLPLRGVHARLPPASVLGRPPICAPLCAGFWSVRSRALRPVPCVPSRLRRGRPRR